MNLLKISYDEKKLLHSYLSSESEIKEVDEVFTVELTDSEAERISENIKADFLYEGFDASYALNSKGKLYQSLIDKFIAIGW